MALFKFSLWPPFDDRRKSTLGLFLPETSFSATGVWPHYCSICRGHQSKAVICACSGASAEKAVTRTRPARAASQDKRCNSAVHFYIYTGCLSTTGSKLPWQLLLESHTEINRGHFPQPFSNLLLQTPTKTVSVAMWMKHNCVQTPPGRMTKKKKKKESTYLAVVHLPHTTTKDREHTYTAFSMLGCATRPEAIRNMPLWEYITHCTIHGHMVLRRSNTQEIFEVTTRWVQIRLDADALDWWYSKISLGAVLELGPALYHFLFPILSVGFSFLFLPLLCPSILLWWCK